MDSEIQCLLWSLNVMNPKYPHIFPDTLSVSYSGPASRPYVLGFTLPKPLACLLQTTTSYHRTPAAQQGPEARPLVYPTLMALFSNSEPFTVEPSTLQESNLTWSTFSQIPHNWNRSNCSSISLYQSPFIHQLPNCYTQLSGCKVSLRRSYEVLISGELSGYNYSLQDNVQGVHQESPTGS